MKYLLTILLMCSTANATVDWISIDNWDKDVVVTIINKGKTFKLKTTKEELEKYDANTLPNDIDNFAKEVGNANKN